MTDPGWEGPPVPVPLGSVRFLLDSSGDLTHALNYDPYGVPLQPHTATTLGFTGEQTDPNDLLYLRARYYHPKLGVFTSVDPVLGVGGSTGWNGYLYANANPANLTDPAGTCVDPLSFVVCAALVGAGIGVTIDAGIQVADIAFNHKPLTSFDWGRTARAGVIGGVGGAVGAGVIGVSALGASYLGITAGANSALAYGVGTIALSGVAGGRAAKLTENALYHRPLDQGLWNPGDIARDALLAVGGTWLFGSAANALTRGNTNYFTAFLPRSFVNLMTRSEATRYRGYWDPPLLSFSSSLNARSYSARAAELRDQISVQGGWYRRFSGDKGNIAIIDYDISGIGEGTIFAHSGKRAASGTAPYIAESSERYFRTIIYRELDRSIDAEAKALEALARRLGATNPPSFEYRLPSIRGTVDLFTELFPCESCGGLTGMNGVIGQFRFLFPNVKVNVHWSR